MGDTLGLDVVIEGIERRSQLAHILEHTNAILGQGYVFGYPAPCADTVHLLSAGRVDVSLEGDLSYR